VDNPSWVTGYMPFFMVYDFKVVLQTDLDHGASRVMAYKEQEAKAFLEDALDQLDEACDITLLCSTMYQQALQWYHSCQVWGRSFNVKDLVIRLV
jgi:hypothetical protein